MSKTDHDLPLKLRAQTVLWALGYHCPLEVAVSVFNEEAGSRKRHDVTDVDVLGIRFDADLSLRSVLVDCKSGHESTPNRLFWLRGLMDFFAADEGYLVKTKIHEHGRLVAPRLGIRTVDESELPVWEEMTGAAKVHPIVGDRAYYEQLTGMWNLRLPKGTSLTADQKALKQAYTYLNYRYWFLEEHRNVLTLLSIFEPLRGVLDPAEPKARLLALVALQRFVLSLLRVARAAVVRRPGDLATEAHQYIFGGATGLQERRQFVALVNKVAPKPISLEPEYFGELLEIVNRLARFAASSRGILRLIDGVVAEEIAGVKAEDVLGSEWNLDSVAMAKRTADLFVVATGIKRDLFTTLLVK